MTSNIIPVDKNLITIERKIRCTHYYHWNKTLQVQVRNHTTLLDTVGLCYLDFTELRKFWTEDFTELRKTIGIKHPVKRKENLGIETLKFCQENITVIEGNRYEVCLGRIVAGFMQIIKIKRKKTSRQHTKTSEDGIFWRVWWY